MRSKKTGQRILNYEMHKYLPKSSQKELKVKETQCINEPMTSEPEVREKKIQALKEQIESGQYKIDYDAVADKLVSSVMDKLS